MVQNYSTLYEPHQFEEKYNYLSAYMEQKSEEIRNSNQYITRRENLETRKSPKRKKTDKLKLSTQISSKPTGQLKAMKSLSQKPQDLLKKNSVLTKMKSFNAKKDDLLSLVQEDDPVLSSLVGYIDKLGMFRLNIHQNEIYYLSTEITENIGFFDKLSFDSNLKAWHNDMNFCFTTHKEILRDVIFSEGNQKLSVSAILNWNYFEEMPCYLVEEKDLT